VTNEFDPAAPLVSCDLDVQRDVLALRGGVPDGARFVSNAGERFKLGRARRADGFTSGRESLARVYFDTAELEVESWALLLARESGGGLLAILGPPRGFIEEQTYSDPPALPLDRLASELYPPARLAFDVGILHLAPREARVIRAAFRLWRELVEGAP
jgi:hypothetical protein